MKPTQTPKSFSRRLQLSLANARFFTFSALIHLVLIIMGGSIVLIKNIPEPPDFEAGDGGLVSPESAAAQPPPAPPAADTPQFQPSAPSVTAPSLAAITSSAVSPSSFQMASVAPTANLDAKLSNLASNATEKMGEKIAAAGARGPGGFFGSRERVVNALVGTFYDLKQTRSKKPSAAATDNHIYTVTYREFINKGWNRSVLDDFYKSKAPLYATQVFIPDMKATEGPKAFDVDKEVEPSRWVVAYKGRVSPPEDGTYHFVGLGDDVLVVRFNGKIVLDACWADKKIDTADTLATWKPAKTYDYGWPAKYHQVFSVGDPMEVRAGQFYDVEVLIGERPGGGCFACLLTEKDGATYEKDRRGNPILPPFRLAGGPPAELEKGQTLPPFQKDGPVWKAAALKGTSGSALDDFFGPK